MELVKFQECLAHRIHRELVAARNSGDIIAYISLSADEWVQVQEDCKATPLLQQLTPEHGGFMVFAGSVPIQVDGEPVKGSGIMLPR